MAKKKQVVNDLEVQNAVKTLFSNIRFQSMDNPIRTVALTSSVPNEGKTVTSIYLAQSMADSGNRVLLVECDMRRRSVGAELGVHGQAGVYAVASGQVPLRQAVVQTRTPNLYFLDAEPGIPNPADIIASNRFRRMVEDMKQDFSYIVFDCPPVGTFVDAAVLSTIVDGTILVVRVNQTKRDDLVNAYEQLQNAGGNILGACATFVEGSSSEYYYAYYNKDGKRVRKKKSKAQVAEPAGLWSDQPVGDFASQPQAQPARSQQSQPAQQAKRAA